MTIQSRKPLEDYTQEDLISLYRENGLDVEATAQALGLQESGPLLGQLLPSSRPIPIQQPSDKTLEWRPKWKKHLVGFRKTSHATWRDASDVQTIKAAIYKYECGTHEIVTKKLDDWYLLYCIPRRRRVAARQYFFSTGY